MVFIEVAIGARVRFAVSAINEMIAELKDKPVRMVFESVLNQKDSVQASLRLDNNERPLIVVLNIKELKAVVNAFDPDR